MIMLGSRSPQTFHEPIEYDFSKFQPIRSEETELSRFLLVEICDPSPKIPYSMN